MAVPEDYNGLLNQMKQARERETRTQRNDGSNQAASDTFSHELLLREYNTATPAESDSQPPENSNLEPDRHAELQKRC